MECIPGIEHNWTLIEHKINQCNVPVEGRVRHIRSCWSTQKKYLIKSDNLSWSKHVESVTRREPDKHNYGKL